ncbi:MAG: hypothetical protein AABP62_22660 [Planctomycetota bacterium]
MNAHVLESLRKTFDAPEVMEWIDCAEPEPTPVPAEPNLAGEHVASEQAVAGDGPLALVELILKNPARLDRLIREPARQVELLPRFLAIALVGFTFFGIAMALVLSASSVWPKLFAMDAVLAGREAVPLRFESAAHASMLTHWLDGDALRLIVAYAVGLIAATGICLPSLYFYGLLAGVRMTMLDVVLHSLKSKAVAAVTLVGVLPIYAAIGLAIAIFPLPASLRDAMLLLGLILPFLAGTAGTYSLYRGLSGLVDTMAAERRCHRACFLRRLVLSWAACYSAVSPVLIFTLWQRLQGSM